MDGFERRKEQSKEEIRRAAENLFTKFGVDKISINDIARQAGVSQATIYNNFGSKDELVRDYRKSIVNLFTRRFREILVWKKSYIEKLQGLLQSWIDLADRYHIETVGLKSAHTDLRRHPEIQPSGDSIDWEIENAFREFITEGRKQGHLGAGISDEATITYIKFFQESISNHPEIQNKMQRDPKLSQDLISLFIYGICGKVNDSTST